MAAFPGADLARALGRPDPQDGIRRIQAQRAKVRQEQAAAHQTVGVKHRRGFGISQPS
jgi:hypothetical protein